MKISPKNEQWTEGKVKGFSGIELLQKTNGSLKLIKIAPMSTYPEHVHPEKTEYAYVLEGTMECKINGESFSGKAGDFFIFPHKQKHALYNRSNEECRLLVGAVAEG